MAQINVRYLTTRPGAKGTIRYFWQPTARLQAQGWQIKRVPSNWRDFTDPAELEMAAITAAQEINRRLDGSRSVISDSPLPTPGSTARTLENLIRLYRADDDYRTLKDTTKRGYNQSIKAIEAWAGDCSVRSIDGERISIFHASIAKRSQSSANAAIRVLRLLLAFAKRKGWVDTNAAEKPKLSGTAPSGLIWPPEAVALFVAVADRFGRHSVGTAVMLNEWIGQRQGDMQKMQRSVYRNGSLIFRQAKGTNKARNREGAGVVLPIDMVPELKARIEDELQRIEKRKVAATTIIVSEETGRAYKADDFRHWFAYLRDSAASFLLVENGWTYDLDRDVMWNAEVAARLTKENPGKDIRKLMEAEERIACSFQTDYLMPGRDTDDPTAFLVCMRDLQYMHLRHTAITRLAEANVELELIAAISGHAYATVPQIIERYMVRTAKMARAAFQQRLDGNAASAKKLRAESSANGASRTKGKGPGDR